MGKYQECLFYICFRDIIELDHTPQITHHHFEGCVKMIETTNLKRQSLNYYFPRYPTQLVYEKKKKYIKHDQLFKELIHHFFEEFLEAFFPKVHEHIDFKSIKPMSEEMFTDLLDGESRRADVIIEAKLKDEETLIIIHVEPQNSHQPNFHSTKF